MAAKKKTPEIQKEQSERFTEAAKTAGVPNDGDTFARAFDKIVLPKQPKPE